MRPATKSTSGGASGPLGDRGEAEPRPAQGEQHDADHGNRVTRVGAPADGGDTPGGSTSNVREQAILDTALGLFLERGYEDVSLARIASAARLTPAEVHRRFGSKADLIGLVLDREIERMRQPFLGGVPHFDTTLEAARYLTSWHSGVMHNTPLMKLMRTIVVAAPRQPELRGMLVASDGVETCQAFMEHVVGELVERGLIRNCDVRTAVRQYFGMMNQALLLEPSATGKPIAELEAYLESCARAFCALYGPDTEAF